MFAWLHNYLVRPMSYTYFTLNILAKYINYILYYYLLFIRGIYTFPLSVNTGFRLL